MTIYLKGKCQIDEQELSQPKQQGLGIKPFKLSKTTDFVEELHHHRTQTGQNRE